MVSEPHDWTVPAPLRALLWWPPLAFFLVTARADGRGRHDRGHRAALAVLGVGAAAVGQAISRRRAGGGAAVGMLPEPAERSAGPGRSVTALTARSPYAIPPYRQSLPPYILCATHTTKWNRELPEHLVPSSGPAGQRYGSEVRSGTISRPRPPSPPSPVQPPDGAPGQPAPRTAEWSRCCSPHAPSGAARGRG